MVELEARRGHRPTTEGRFYSNRQIGSAGNRLKDRSKDSQKRFQGSKRTRDRQASEVKRKDRKFSSGEIETFGRSSVVTKKDATLNNGDLESRFWTDGVCESKALCTTSRARETRRAAPPSYSDRHADLSSLHLDVLRTIAGPLSWPDLWAATRVCKAWRDSLAPLREGMRFLHRGKNYKHGKGVPRNLEKALDCLTKGAARGCTAAMVDAGLLLWETGRRKEGVEWYKKAGELGDAAGQCNLGIAYLQEPSRHVEAVNWFHRAAISGHVRAQYSLALCLQHGRGIEQDAREAAQWYLRAAEGGSARAMYNSALCFSRGEGFERDGVQARRWKRKAALAGHREAQFEHGLALIEEGDRGLGLVFLELAVRSGESAGAHLRDSLLQQLKPSVVTYAMACADGWERRRKEDLGC